MEEKRKANIIATYEHETQEASCTIQGSVAEVVGMLSCIFEALYQKEPIMGMVIIKDALKNIAVEEKDENK